MHSTEPPTRLAPREVEMLQLLAGGLTNPVIGERMGVTLSTADSYAQRLRTKLNVRTRTQLVVRAIELGYLSPAGLPVRTRPCAAGSLK